jgi:hypothetical protein
MPTADTYSARFTLPDLIERGVAGTLRCPMYRSGALVAPSSGTVTVFDASGTAVVDAATATITSSVATYAWTPPTTLSLGERWRVRWSLAMPDGVTHRPENEAALVRARLYCPITEADLYRMESALDPSGAAPLTSLSSYADKIDEAWTQIQLRLIEAGNRPNLIIGPSSLRQVALDLALSLCFADVGSRVANPVHTETAMRYRAAYETAWQRISLTYDTTDTGNTNDAKRSPSRSVWLGGWNHGTRFGWGG